MKRNDEMKRLSFGDWQIGPFAQRTAAAFCGAYETLNILGAYETLNILGAYETLHMKH